MIVVSFRCVYQVSQLTCSSSFQSTQQQYCRPPIQVNHSQKRRLGRGRAPLRNNPRRHIIHIHCITLTPPHLGAQNTQQKHTLGIQTNTRISADNCNGCAHGGGFFVIHMNTVAGARSIWILYKGTVARPLTYQHRTLLIAFYAYFQNNVYNIYIILRLTH